MSATETMEMAPEVQKFLSYGAMKLLIDGKWVPSASGKTFATTNPADESELAQIAQGNAEDINRAVAAARKAFETGPWRKTSGRQRGRLLYRLADLIEQHAEEFAQLESLDNGKPASVARVADVPMTIEHFRYYAGWADKIEGETIPVSPHGEADSHLNYTLREPIGVAGQIIPWNFPLLMAAWKLGAALACGCTIVLKPAEQTPLTALRLGGLIMEAGFPAGVVNIVTGYGDAGAALASHPDVDKIAFTGSTEVGHKIMQASANSNLKRVTLELGGKSPNIIFDDADLDAAAAGAGGGIFFNQGQTCCAGSRLFVHRKAYDRVIEMVADQAKKTRLGPGMAAETEMGPLVSAEQLERVTGYLQLGQREGAKVVAGGKRANGDLSGGYFVEPTVFGDVSNNMQIMREEIFGPVICATRFDELEEVAAAANDTEYGLAAGIWTRDIGKAHRLARMIKAGSVWINCYNMFDAASPFGGYKKSGFGREMGHHALDNYTQTKSVWVSMT